MFRNKPAWTLRPSPRLGQSGFQELGPEQPMDASLISTESKQTWRFILDHGLFCVISGEPGNR